MTVEELLSYDLTFDPTATAFTATNALFLAVAAECAYSVDSGSFSAPEVFQPHGFTEVIPFQKTRQGAEGFAMISDGALVISFCGTNEPKDWLTNLQVGLHKDHGALIHHGFWSALASLWEGEAKLVQRLKQEVEINRKPVWFCGHSLGGALAVLAAFRCRNLDVPVQGVYTFGQPLVGEGHFKNAFGELENRIFRFMNAKDPVPLLPIKGRLYVRLSKRKRARMGKRRTHSRRKPISLENIGVTYLFDEDGHLEEGAVYPNLPLNYLSGVFRGLRAGLGVDHHLMGRYITNISRLTQ